MWARFARLRAGRGAELEGARVRGPGPGGRLLLVPDSPAPHLPNIINPLVVLATLQVGWVIIVEASLSFLGAGIPPPTPS